MPEDMDSFFAEDPRATPEFALKTEKYEKHETEPYSDSDRDRSHSGEYYNPYEDRRYIYPEHHADSHHYYTGRDYTGDDDWYDYSPHRYHQYANDDNDEKYYPVPGPHR